MFRALPFAALLVALVAPVGARGSQSPHEPSKKRHVVEKSDKGKKSAKSGKSSKGSREKEERPSKKFPAVELSHLSTHEQFELRPDGDGHFSAKRLKGLRHFLRCHHTGREHAMAPRLAQLIWSTAHHFGDRAVTVIAGYRAPKVAKKKGNPRSPHKRGVACDFRLAGVSNGTLRDYLRTTFHDVGVGFYPNSGFVHLDVGRKQSAFWIDYSGPGERAEYSRDPDGDLATGRAVEQGTAEPGSDGEDDETLPYADDPGMADLLHPGAPTTASP